VRLPVVSRLAKFGRIPRTVPVHDAYELWAPTYPPVAHNPLMRTEQEVFETLLRGLHVRRALDVGTGSGRYLPLLAATGASVVAGVDFSRAMLAQGRARARLVCGDARRLPFRRDLFDLVIAALMIGDVDDLSGCVREMAGTLMRGGHLMYSDFHPSWAFNGWRRTFRTDDGETLAVPYAPHSIEEHLDAIASAGLQVVAVREPRLNGDGADPAVKAFRRKWGNPPVVVIFHAVKEGRFAAGDGSGRR
jgi:malonyl-CoA O-methyltransferase